MTPIALSRRRNGRFLLYLSLSLPLWAFLPHPSSTLAPNYIDSTTRPTWDSLVTLIRLKSNSLGNEIEQLKANNPPDSIKDPLAYNKALFLTNRKYRLDTLLANLQRLEKSEIKYLVTIISKTTDSSKVIDGCTCYDLLTQGIQFKIGDISNFVHEVTHGLQLEDGKLAYDKKNGDSFGNDIEDEIEAYKMQFAYSPDSVAGLQS
ncbi:MAG: hypothetical protein JST68_13195, partial [Bacteroidetes bacterium]|nr:hypothetical protein [Bacteroidota bacterium]